MGGTSSTPSIGPESGRRIPYGKVDPRLSGLWTGVCQTDGKPCCVRMELDSNGMFLPLST